MGRRGFIDPLEPLMGGAIPFGDFIPALELHLMMVKAELS